MAKKDPGFSLSNGLIDHLNLEKFNSKCGLMIYLKLHAASQSQERVGKGEISLRVTSRELKSSEQETFEGMVNLEKIKFVEFEIMNDKNILSPKGLEFYKQESVRLKLLKKFSDLPENADSYELAIKLFSSLKLSAIVKYLDHLYLPNLRFKYSIVKYKDKKKLKTETKFDSDMYRVLRYFESAKYFYDERGKETQSTYWRTNNLRIIKELFRDLREVYGNSLGDQFCVEFVEDMVDYALSNKFLNSRIYSFKDIRYHEQEIKDGVRNFRDIMDVLKNQETRSKKIRLMVKVTEDVMKVKLSPSNKKMLNYYYFDISDMDMALFKRALTFISNKETFERGAILDFREIAKAARSYREELRKNRVA